MNQYQEEELKHTRPYDRLGLILSGLCFLHCVFTPVYLASLPALHEASIHLTFHSLMAPTLLIIAAFAFFRGYRLHKRKPILVLGLLGLSFLFSGVIWTSSHSIYLGPVTLDIALTIAGSIVLIITHLLNMKFCKDACCTQ